MAAKVPDPSKIDAVAKAMEKIAKARAAADAMDKAREKMGMMSVAAEKAARANERLAKSQQKAAKASQEQASKRASAAAERASAADIESRAASMAEAEAAAIGAVEAVAAAAVVAVTALAAATALLASKAIEVVQQRAGLLATFAALGGGAAAGKKTLAMVDELSKKLPFASDQIAGWAKSLEAAGLEGDKLKSAITAVASATAIMGDSGGAAAEKMIKQLAEGGEAATKMLKAIQEGSPKSARLLADMGLRVEDVAAAMGMTVAQFRKATISADQMNAALQKALTTKGAGALGEMMLTFPVIIQKVKEGLLSLFEGLGPSVKGFMKAVQNLFGQFGRGTPIIRALKPIVTEVFGTLFKYATLAVRAISKFVRENLSAKNIGSTWKSIKDAIAKVVNVLGIVWKVLKPILTSPLFLKGIVTIFKVIAVVVVLVVAAMAAFAAIVGVVMGTLATLATLLWGVIGTILDFAGAALSAGADFISGLVNGISSGAGAVVDAVKNLASSALAAFKSVLGIASPSKVMMKMGGFAAEGAAQGLDKGASGVADSAAALGEGVKGGTAKGMSGAGGKGKGGGITINGGVHIEVPHGTPSAWAEEAFAAFMERLAASQGAT